MNYKQIYFITLTSLFLFLNSFDFTLAEAANQRFGVRTDPQGRSLIFDKSNYQNINLWGVNYYPMGSLTQWLMKKSGLTNMEQWKTEIQKDLQDLAFIHVNFIRIHVFDREISNACGDLVDNEHLDLLEYLIDQAGQKGMTVQLTPIGWWWSPYTQSSSLSHIWHKKAFILGGMFNPKSKGLKKTNDCGENTSLWDRQNRFTSQLLSKINRYNKISMGHQPSIAMIEIMNEPEFWNYDEVKKAADAAWAPSSLPEDVQKIPWYLNDLKLV